MSVMALYLVSLKLLNNTLKNNNTLFGERTWKYVSEKKENPQVQCNNFPTFVFGLFVSLFPYPFSLFSCLTFSTLLKLPPWVRDGRFTYDSRGR